MNADSPRLTFRVFGFTQARWEDGSEIKSQKALALLALLVFSLDGSRSRRFLATTLWSEIPYHVARSNLRHTLRELRKGTNQSTADFLKSDRDTVSIDLSVLEIEGHTDDGPFLDSLLLDASPRFLHWCEEVIALDAGRVVISPQVNPKVRNAVSALLGLQFPKLVLRSPDYDQPSMSAEQSAKHEIGGLKRHEVERILRKAREAADRELTKLQEGSNPLERFDSLPSTRELLIKELNDIQEGHLLCNPPEQMRVGESAEMEVRVTRVLTDFFNEGLKGEGESRYSRLAVGSVMRVQLTGPDFSIISYSEPNQAVLDADFGRWVWSISPKKSGELILTVRASVILKASGISDTVKELPTLEHEVTVLVNPIQTLAKVGGENWRWFAGALLIPGAVWTANQAGMLTDFAHWLKETFD